MCVCTAVQDITTCLRIRKSIEARRKTGTQYNAIPSEEYGEAFEEHDEVRRPLKDWSP